MIEPADDPDDAPDEARPGFQRSGLVIAALALVMLGMVVAAAIRDPRPARHPETRRAADEVRHADPGRRLRAAADLGNFGRDDHEVAIPALAIALDDADAHVRAEAASSLSMIAGGAGETQLGRDEARRAVALLLDARRDPDPSARAAKVRALWISSQLWEGPGPLVDRVEIRDALVDLAIDPDPEVRRAVVAGLGMIGPMVDPANPPAGLVRALEDGSPRVREAAVQALAHHRDGLLGRFPDLVRAFESARPEARPAYLALFGRIRPRAFTPGMVPALANALGSPDPDVRTAAAEALSAFEVDARSAIPGLALAAVPRDGEGDGRPALAAARALLRVAIGTAPMPEGPPPAIDPPTLRALAEALRSGGPEVREAVALAFGRFEPTREFIPILERAAGDPDPTVRASAFQALHDVGDRLPFAPGEVFRRGIEDDSPRVRYWAAGALGHAGREIDPFLPALLVHARRDPDAEVRGVCLVQIREFVPREAVTVAAVPLLIGAMEGEDAEVRAAACGLLARLGPLARDAAPRLGEMAREADPTISRAAKSALRAIESEK